MRALLMVLLVYSSVVAKEYKAVFDCSSSDARYIMTRVMLIDKTMEMFKDQGDDVDFVVTLHGGCVAMTSQNYEDIVDDSDLNYIAKAQQTLKSLAHKGVAVTACAMSLDANGVDKEEVLPFIKISRNSFIDTIKYQNSGYALMSFK